MRKANRPSKPLLGSASRTSSLTNYSSKRPWDAQKRKRYVLTFMFKLLGCKSACKTFAGSNEILRWLTPFLGPNMDPKMGSTFSFLLLGLCLGPVLGSRFGPKSGASHRKILLLAADVLQADLRRTSMSVSVNACFFSLCVPICFLYIVILSCRCPQCTDEGTVRQRGRRQVCDSGYCT